MNSYFKTVALVLCLSISAQADTFTASTIYPGTAPISFSATDVLSVVQFGVDNLPAVDANMRYAVTDLRLRIDLDHAWASDIEAALMFGDQLVGLFYDAGRGANFASGAGAAYWIHMDGDDLPSIGTIPSGTYRPDVGENTIVDDLGVFHGLDPNGHWMLHIKDDFPADDGVFYGWELELDLEIVPEPSATLLLTIGMLGLIRRKK